MDTKEKNEFMEVLDGHEIWTNAFGKRFGEKVCVMIESKFIICNGTKFKPTLKEVHELNEDYIIQEYGSREQMNNQLKAEFGGQ